MKIYKIMFLLIPLFFIGCVKKEPIKVYEIVEVPKIIVCTPPKVTCDFKGEGWTPTIKLVECIMEQKRAIEYCSNIKE